MLFLKTVRIKILFKEERLQGECDNTTVSDIPIITLLDYNQLTHQ